MKVFLWALPAGETDRLYEQPLTSFALTTEQADKVTAAARKDGWHSFRAVKESFDVPDFGGAVLSK